MNMSFKYLFLTPIVLLFISAKSSFSQLKLSGNWRGAEIIDSSDIGSIFELDLKIIGGLADGFIKVKKPSEDIYIKKIIGAKKYTELELKESSTVFNTHDKSAPKNTYEFKYNLETGYLETIYDSTKQSRIVLYQEDYPFNSKSKSLQSEHWINSFVLNYRSGISAPKKRLQELREFKFTPIYFEVDQSIILKEYHSQLMEIIKIIKSHSDLRIQVTGHTDSDGTNIYNKHLSKRRAESIIKYFTKRGLRRDRIVIDFKGEREPAESNTTKDGKQKNRRVDFRFI